METVLQGIPNVIDDILVTSATDEELAKMLSLVLERLERAGFRACKSKCKFMQPSVTYLGHKIDWQGLHPPKEKVRVVQDAPSPKSVTELKYYLGLFDILQQIPAQHGRRVSSVIQAAPKRCPLAMDTC